MKRGDVFLIYYRGLNRTVNVTTVNDALDAFAGDVYPPTTDQNGREEKWGGSIASIEANLSFTSWIIKDGKTVSSLGQLQQQDFTRKRARSPLDDYGMSGVKAEPQCNHKWAKYDSGWRSFVYCEHCDLKKEQAS